MSLLLQVTLYPSRTIVCAPFGQSILTDVNATVLDFDVCHFLRAKV